MGCCAVALVLCVASCEEGGAWLKLDVAAGGLGPWEGLVLRGLSMFGWNADEASLGSWTKRLA